MEYLPVIFLIILAVLNESSDALNPEILKYDQHMIDFEKTGRRLKQEKEDMKLAGLIVKRENHKNPENLNVTTGTSVNTDASVKQEYKDTLENECLRQLGFAGKEMSKLSVEALGKVLGCMNTNHLNLKKKLSECQDQDYFRSLLDMFSSQHYPDWFPVKTTKKEEKWERLFLNVHDPVINKIKCLLKKDENLDEKSFREKFVYRGYRFWGSEQHPITLTPQAEKVIRECMTILQPSKPVEYVINIMIEDVKGNKSGLESLYTEYQISNEKFPVNEVNLLKLYKALKITNLNEVFEEDETKLRKELAEENHGIVWKKFNTGTVYILFQSFTEAYSVWEKVVKDTATYTSNGEATNVAIINPFTDIGSEYKTFCRVKVPCSVNKTRDQEFSNGIYIPEISRLQDVTFYTYRNVFDAVQVFEKYKNKVEKFCPDSQKLNKIQLVYKSDN